MVERVEVKDVRVPEQLQRAMAAEAEAARNARAKVIAAEGEHKASRSLRLAAEVITDSPAALQVLARATALLSIVFRQLTGNNVVATISVMIMSPPTSFLYFTFRRSAQIQNLFSKGQLK